MANERGGYSHVTYHGLGNAYNNRMQVLIDGRSVYSPYFVGGVDWFAIPLTIDEIERIDQEVIALNLLRSMTANKFNSFKQVEVNSNLNVL